MGNSDKIPSREELSQRDRDFTDAADLTLEVLRKGMTGLAEDVANCIVADKLTRVTLSDITEMQNAGITFGGKMTPQKTFDTIFKCVAGAHHDLVADVALEELEQKLRKKKD